MIPYEELTPIKENEERITVEYEDDGRVKRLYHYSHAVLSNFRHEVYQKAILGKILWNKPRDKENEYKVAKEIYEERYRKLNLPESAVEMYK